MFGGKSANSLSTAMIERRGNDDGVELVVLEADSGQFQTINAIVTECSQRRGVPAWVFKLRFPDTWQNLG